MSNKRTVSNGSAWIIKILAPGHPDRYAAGLGVSEDRADASVFDSRDNKEMKLAFFTAIICKLAPGATCQAEPLN